MFHFILGNLCIILTWKICKKYSFQNRVHTGYLLTNLSNITWIQYQDYRNSKLQSCSENPDLKHLFRKFNVCLLRLLWNRFHIWCHVVCLVNKAEIDLCFIDYAKAFDCVDHNKLWKILQEMGIPDHLSCLLRKL